MIAALVVLVTADLAGSTKRWGVDRNGTMTLTFVPNRGQVRSEVLFLGQRDGFRFAFLRGEILLAFTRGTKEIALALEFVGADVESLPEGSRPGERETYHLIDNASLRWERALPMYEEIVYRDLWPSIDLVFRGGEGRLEYVFLVHPGGDVSKIRLAWHGAEALALDPAGRLQIETSLGVLNDARPLSYQESGGHLTAVGSRYLLHEGASYGFGVDPYDACQTLVIGID